MNLIEMEKGIKSKAERFVHLLKVHNTLELQDLLSRNKGSFGYCFDIGGDENGCFGCKIMIYCRNGNVIVVRQRQDSIGRGSATVIQEFNSFVKRYKPLLGKLIPYRGYKKQITFSEKYIKLYHF